MILHVIIFSDSGFPLCYVRIHSLSVHDLYATYFSLFFLPGLGHPLIIGAKHFAFFNVN